MVYIYEKVPKVSKIHFCQYLLSHLWFYFFFCKNTLVRSIRKKSSNWSEICNLYSLAIILTKFHRFFNAPFVTIFSLILLEDPVLLLLYSYMQNLPNRSLSSHILFVVFVVVQGSQKTRVRKFGLVSKTLSIGIKS